MTDIIKQIRSELKANANAAIREGSKRFFKEPIQCHGLRTAHVKKISREFFKQIKSLSKQQIFSLCDELWQTGYMEESFIACDWSYAVRKQYAPADFKVFRKWVNSCVSNWAQCDTLCNHTVGEFVEMYPQYVAELKKWAKSSNRWMRRAAAVSLIVPARRGKFLADTFEIADMLLRDEDDLVQKGYGWLLKAASESHCEEVFEYVMSRKHVMPRTALRYAIEKMDPSLKSKAMAKQ